DVAGNVEATTTVTVLLDTLHPDAVIDSPAPGTVTSATVSPSWHSTDPSATTQATLNGSPFSPGSTVATDGVYTLVVTATDQAGNETSASVGFEIDATSPDVAITPSPLAPTGLNGWYATSPVFAEIASGDYTALSLYSLVGESGPWSVYLSPVALSSEGTNTIWAYAVDTVGNASAVTSLSVRTDTLGTETTSDIDEAWQRGPVTVTLSENTDGLAPATTFYRLDSGEPTTYTAPFAVSTEGTTSVEYWSVDEAGNTEIHTTKVVSVDTVAPVTSYTPSATWSTEPFDITLSREDTTSGLFETYFAWDGAAVSTYTAPLAALEGAHELSYYSVDVAGNVEATTTVTVLLDTVAPLTTSDTVSTYLNTATVNLTSADLDSGVQYTRWRLDGGIWNTGTTVTTSTAGAHTLEFYSLDNAGNIEITKAASFTVMTRFEQADPLLVYNKTWALQTHATYFSGGTHRIVNEPAASVIAAFTGTRIDWISTTAPDYGIARVTLDGGTPFDVDMYSATHQRKQTVWSASGLSPGAHTLRIEWTGRKNAASTLTYIAIDALDVDGSLVVVDLTAPVSTLTADPTWSQGPVEFTLTATDTITAVAHSYYKLNGGETQTYTSPVSVSSEGVTTIAYWSVDVRGNTETMRNATVRVDDTAPVTTSDIDEAWQTGPVTATLSET
ncbi:hypothetical protein EG835_02830, partial [bacterium]|nr:hypothetical protein [bacterium]